MRKSLQYINPTLTKGIAGFFLDGLYGIPKVTLPNASSQSHEECWLFPCPTKGTYSLSVRSNETVLFILQSKVVISH